MLLATALIGAVSGLIVSSWQGFKDPPWEGFFVRKFMRSILVGAGAGVGFFLADARGLVALDNLGVLAFAIVAVERIIGESYKGFLRPGAHPEYHILLRRLRLPVRFYGAKLLLGGGFLVGVYYLVRLFAWLAERLIAWSDSLTLAGAAVGLVSGVLVAVGGALKDSQFEGFLPRKFIRSPIVGLVAGSLFVHLTASPFLLVLACIGGERAGVECYKTFLRRQVRGIFAGLPPRYPRWLAVRFVFGILYGLAVGLSIVLLLVNR